MVIKVPELYLQKSRISAKNVIFQTILKCDFTLEKIADTLLLLKVSCWGNFQVGVNRGIYKPNVQKTRISAKNDKTEIPQGAERGPWNTHDTPP